MNRCCSPVFSGRPSSRVSELWGGGALKKDGRLILWVLQRVCICCAFYGTFASAGPLDGVGDVAGRAFQMDLAVGSTSGDLSVWGGCTLV